MFEDLKYIYIHKEKVKVEAFVMEERFDKDKISKSIKKIRELYKFDFDERNIYVESADKTVCLKFEYANDIHRIYLGYNSSKKMIKMIHKKATLLFNLHYINHFNVSMFNRNNVRGIHNFYCPSIQACFSFWETELVFNGMMFLEDMEFYGAYFLRNVTFYKCEFKGNLYCRYTKFLKKTNFNSSIFSEIVVFDSFTFYDLSLKKTIFKDKVIFTKMNILLSRKEKDKVSLCIYDSELENLDITFDEHLVGSMINLQDEYQGGLKKREIAKILSSEFQLLNKIFCSKNFYIEEDYSFLLYRKYKMKSYPFGIKKCYEYIYYIIGGFGTKLNWIIASCVFVLILFVFIYLIFYINVIGFSEQAINESIILSMQSFFSFSYLNLNTETVSLLFPIICFENILGHVLIIYFTITFSRKAVR